jgi:hypothetical protein
VISRHAFLSTPIKRHALGGAINYDQNRRGSAVGKRRENRFKRAFLLASRACRELLLFR